MLMWRISVLSAAQGQKIIQSWGCCKISIFVGAATAARDLTELRVGLMRSVPKVGGRLIAAPTGLLFCNSPCSISPNRRPGRQFLYVCISGTKLSVRGLQALDTPACHFPVPYGNISHHEIPQLLR